MDIDACAHSEIAGVVRMKSVLFADAVGGNGTFSLQRSRNIVDGRAIEIDDRVEKTAGPDEGSRLCGLRLLP